VSTTAIIIIISIIYTLVLKIPRVKKLKKKAGMAIGLDSRRRRNRARAQN